MYSQYRMIRRIGGDIMFSQGMLSETAFIQHGTVSVYAHCIGVAMMCLFIADRLRLNVDRRSLVRGALLHDYFLYDWHDPDPSHRLHGFRHPATALRNAERDFELNDIEKNMIWCHMFPMTITHVPKYKESIILCLADKIVATREIIIDRRKKLSRLLASHLF